MLPGIEPEPVRRQHERQKRGRRRGGGGAGFRSGLGSGLGSGRLARQQRLCCLTNSLRLLCGLGFPRRFRLLGCLALFFGGILTLFLGRKEGSLCVIVVVLGSLVGAAQ